MLRFLLVTICLLAIVVGCEEPATKRTTRMPVKSTGPPAPPPPPSAVPYNPVHDPLGSATDATAAEAATQEITEQAAATEGIPGVSTEDPSDLLATEQSVEPPLPPTPHQSREWTTKKGSTTGQLVRLNESLDVVIYVNDQEIVIPFNALSQADRGYVVDTLGYAEMFDTPPVTQAFAGD